MLPAAPPRARAGRHLPHARLTLRHLAGAHTTAGVSPAGVILRVGAASRSRSRVNRGHCAQPPNRFDRDRIRSFGISGKSGVAAAWSRETPPPVHELVTSCARLVTLSRATGGTFGQFQLNMREKRIPNDHFGHRV
ncbi:hypothetical protein GCM10010430_09610 [Kitasatospora cystarginea]|uniref:Uncharacterized protein n=1 Tax=Kitasatospora cystarginea TaxID=58350 RepID=A0ABN3DHQ6_9ACTN